MRGRLKKNTSLWVVRICLLFEVIAQSGWHFEKRNSRHSSFDLQSLGLGAFTSVHRILGPICDPVCRENAGISHSLTSNQRPFSILPHPPAFPFLPSMLLCLCCLHYWISLRSLIFFVVFFLPSSSRYCYYFPIIYLLKLVHTYLPFLHLFCTYALSIPSLFSIPLSNLPATPHSFLHSSLSSKLWLIYLLLTSIKTWRAAQSTSQSWRPACRFKLPPRRGAPNGILWRTIPSSPQTDKTKASELRRRFAVKSH